MTDYGIYSVGLLAQALFSARLLIQWIKSERAGRVLSPTLFWQLSLLGSLLLCTYGILRDDPVIIVGQVLPYAIYIRNLQYKGAWASASVSFRTAVIVLPILGAVWLVVGTSHDWRQILYNPAISHTLLAWGSIGQVIYSSRFLYQWYYSRQVSESVLPPGFWWISAAGAVTLLAYGFYRLDPILLLSHSFGLFVYVRNLLLGGERSPGHRAPGRTQTTE